jgi:hypothetical protein
VVRAICVYCGSLLVTFLVFYVYERSKVGALPRRTVFVMAQMAALFALVPTGFYVFVRILPRMLGR